MFSFISRKSVTVLDDITGFLERNGGNFNSTGDKHCQRYDFPVQKFKPGWYFIEVGLASSQTFTNAVFVVEYGDKTEELYLSLRGGTLNKRLIWFRSTPKAFYFELGEPVVALEFSRFRFDRTVALFAISRMKWRLHFRDVYTYYSFGKMWEAYNKTFIPGAFEYRYKYWIKEVESKFKQYKVKDDTSLSIIIYPGSRDLESLNRTISSIDNQSYKNLEILVVSGFTGEDGTPAKTVPGPDIKYLNGDSTDRLLNKAVGETKGELVIFLKSGDTLHANSLSNIIHFYKLIDSRLLYGDDDVIDQEAERSNPRFKPGWNPYYLYSYDYISNFVIFDRSLISDYRFGPETEGVETFALLLWCIENYNLDNNVIRIPRILVHQDKNTAGTACSGDLMEKKRSLLHRFLNRGDGQTDVEIAGGIFRLKNTINRDQPGVSIIIPTRDNYSVIKQCITSILEKTSYGNYEIIVLNNQSVDENTLAYFQELNRYENIRVVDYDHPFNYSKINNYGVSISNGEIICFLNDDTAVMNNEWLYEMVSYVIRPEVGCVGAKLYYSNGKIQHGGVVLGLGHVAGHAHRYFPMDAPGYLNRLVCTQYISAVTGACLMIRKNVFNEVNGFDGENLTVAYNDVDFCIRVRNAGYYNLWTPNAQLYHYESLSRGADNTRMKRRRYRKEVRFMHKKWSKILADDPYYHPCLTNRREDFSLRS